MLKDKATIDQFSNIGNELYRNKLCLVIQI